MISNLCFSFRGLHQKLLRESPQGSKQELDDFNLQYRMQQIGALIFLLPAITFELPGSLAQLYRFASEKGLFTIGILIRYTLFSLFNGFAFASYNLASTYILTRISVVHHAALNCIRRVFAIIATSIAFGVPITFLSAFGITISVLGFMSFTHYKLQKLKQPPPLSALLPMSAV